MDLENICLLYIDPDELLYLTGWTHEEFLTIIEITPTLYNCPMTNAALAIYLIKLRTRDSNERLGVSWNAL